MIDFMLDDSRADSAESQRFSISLFIPVLELDIFPSFYDSIDSIDTEASFVFSLHFISMLNNLRIDHKYGRKTFIIPGF